VESAATLNIRDAASNVPEGIDARSGEL